MNLQNESQYNDFLKLETGKRYTLLTMSCFGIGASCVQFTMETVKFGKYAQYEDSVELVFKLKNKRNLRGMRFYGNNSFAVWEGWIQSNTNAFEAFPCSIFPQAQKSKYLSFDKRYLTDAIASVSAKPLFTNINLTENGASYE